MTTGGDPAALDRLAAGGAGQAFTLVRTAHWLNADGARHRRLTPNSGVHTAPTAARLRVLADRIRELDTWVRTVAAALEAADTGTLQLGILALGAHHPTVAAAPTVGTPPTVAHLVTLSDEQLAAVAAVPVLPATWRDPVHRMRVQRWLTGLSARIDGVPADDRIGLLARWTEAWVLDPIEPIVDLYRTRAEEIARLRAEAEAARRLLARRDLSVLSFDPGDPPAIRIGLGDPGTATHLAVLVPGTGSGLHAADTSLTEATELHRHATGAAPRGVRVATILDLYAAPVDLGRAGDRAPADRAGAATAAFLADLPNRPRTTLVGHSYGAVTAARASDHHHVDDLVLLGAPGVGVVDRTDLTGATRVWAARAGGDPIGLVADLDELLHALPPRWRPATGPLADPLAAHGPDPTDPEFGALPLPTAARGPGIAGVAARGHLEYLRPGTVSLDSVAQIVVGLPLAIAPATRVRRGQPPRRDRRDAGGAG